MKKNYNIIQTPQEVKRLSNAELVELSASLKNDIVQHTSVNGGHIGASLCCVDMIVALHKVFHTPEDAFIFDVGHQAYAHKMLTERRFKFYKLRKENGISGFTNRTESIHDGFGAGHASTSISAALGMLEGKKRNGDDGYVIAVIGDGALTGGLSFEGLNHAGELARNLIIIFNDNKISIDANVGALRHSFEKIKGGAKAYFNLLGIDYRGPFDGHHIPKLVEIFRTAKGFKHPILIHLNTIKGHSYLPAEKDKIRFHGCGPFDVETGNAIVSVESKKKYQELFAETLTELATKDDRIVAITAAMPTGTSLNKFKKVHPDKFYDVGLAEQHAVEFAAGLATQGSKPFVCIYSTFLQRSYDQLIHDIGLQNLPVRVCMDRGGLVGDDGATHQGVFDYAFLRTIPNYVVMAPKDDAELQHMMETARLYDQGPISIRFPRGEVKGATLPVKLKSIPIGKAEHIYGDTSGDVLICAIGTTVDPSIEAAKELEHEYKMDTSVINLRFAKPLDEEMILDFARQFKAVVTVEEGIVCGGVGSAILELFSREMILTPTRVLGVPDRFIEHASQERQREICGINFDSIVKESVDLMSRIEGSSLPRQLDNVTLLPIKVASLRK